MGNNGCFEGVDDVDRALAARTLKDYDDVLTAPLHGFSGADEHYDRAQGASSAPSSLLANE